MTDPFVRMATGGEFPANAMLPPVNPFLGLIPKKYWGRRKEFFTYPIGYYTNSPSTNGQPLAASAVAQQASVNIDGDSDFLLLLVTGLLIATDNTTTVNNAPALIQIADGASSQAISLNPVHFSTVVGDGSNPFFVPFPRVFAKNGSIQTRLWNLEAAARNVYLSFHGFKIFDDTPT